MARVTVEDCLKQIPNRFDLVMKATKRARQLAMTGTEPLVPWENDKVTVVALREFAEGKLNPDHFEGNQSSTATSQEGASLSPETQTPVSDNSSTDII